MLYFNVELSKITALNLIQFEIICIIISVAQQFTGQYPVRLKRMKCPVHAQLHLTKDCASRVSRRA